MLSEEGFAESPVGAVAQVQRLLERGDPAALCSHGPVLPTRSACSTPGWPTRWNASASRTLQAAADEAMHKGEVLVCHLVGRGEDARVVDVERIDT